ncbi:MAG: flagellar biosynthetic protein FliO [Terracidiphilus sp.]
MKIRTATPPVASQSPMPNAAEGLGSSLLVFPGGTSLKSLQNASGLLSRAWNWFRERQATRSNSRRLQVAASISLGEKRFIAVVTVDGQQFLVGGGASNVALLAALQDNESFGDLLQESMTSSKLQPARRVRQYIAKPAAERKGAQA